MSLRIRPIRSILGVRSIHSSTSRRQADATSPAPPKPRSAVDLGFGNRNATRVRDLGKIDLPTRGGGNIDLSLDSTGKSRSADPASRTRSGPRPPPRAQRRDAYASKPKVNVASSQPATDFFEHSEVAASSDGSSANGARRRASLARVEIDDMEIPTIESASAGTPAGKAPQRAAGSMPPRGPPRRPGGPPGGYRSGGQGAGGPGGARAGPGGPRGQGGQRRTGGAKKQVAKKPRDGRSNFNLGEVQLQAMREQWEGAPMPPAPTADVTPASLFGKNTVVGAFAPVPNTSQQPLWATGLSPQELAKKQAERRMGSYETVLPSVPFPSDRAAKGKPAAMAQATFAWQMALNPTVSMAADAKKVQAASEMVRKAVA